MFGELTQELLDLEITEKGFGLALYAAEEDEGCSACSCSCTWSLCCTI